MWKQEHEAQHHTVLDNKSFTGTHKKATSYKKHHKNIRSWPSGTEVMRGLAPVFGQYPNKNSISEAPFSVLGKRSISNESWTFQLLVAIFGKFTACESVAEGAVLFRLVSFNFMANIYAVYCAEKLEPFRNRLAKCDIFKETVLF